MEYLGMFFVGVGLLALGVVAFSALIIAIRAYVVHILFPIMDRIEQWEDERKERRDHERWVAAGSPRHTSFKKTK